VADAMIEAEAPMALVTLQTIFQDAFSGLRGAAPAARPCPESRPRDHAVYG